MPTEDGTVIHKGRTPAYDATSVQLLRQAGAIIMGKTVTTEMAVYSPGKTKNPHDPLRTPGGSSSGSAAAVAANMVPLALGTQTNGSIIRPASFCGVVGYKPSHGLISRYRVLQQSLWFDTVGVFSRDVDRCSIDRRTIDGLRSTRPSNGNQDAAQARSNHCAKAPLVPPKLAFVKTPAWNEYAENDTKDGFTELAEVLWLFD